MTRAQLFVANNIPENSKTAIRQKSIKTNLENRQLLMMTLLQHQKLISAFFLKTILHSGSQRKNTIMPMIQQKQMNFLKSILDLLYRSITQK